MRRTRSSSTPALFALALAAGASIGPSPLSAQAAPADAAPATTDGAPTESVEVSSPIPPPPPASAAASPAPVAPAAPQLSTVVAGIPIRVTGILHARVEAGLPVQSFDNATAVAPTSALNPAVHAAPNDPNLTFQVQQTRVGMILGEGTDVRGQIEIDFVHFDQSSPTVQAYPRIRIANLEWTFAPNQRVFLGQNWDIFGNASTPLIAHTYNLVGALFRAGNIAFMRHQLGWSGRFDAIEVAIAAGLQGANTGPSFGNLEEAMIPTGSARVMVHVDPSTPASTVGVSGIATALRFTSSGMPNEFRPALGGDLFADLTFGPLNVHAELYAAQNLSNTGALNLGFGRYGHDLVDVGGYASGRLTLGQHVLSAMFGAAGVVNASEVAPGYTPASGTTTLGTATPATGPGIVYNLSAQLAYGFQPVPGLTIFAQPYLFVTRFKLDDADVGRFSPDRIAGGGMLGSMFQI